MTVLLALRLCSRDVGCRCTHPHQQEGELSRLESQLLWRVPIVTQQIKHVGSRKLEAWAGEDLPNTPIIQTLPCPSITCRCEQCTTVTATQRYWNAHALHLLPRPGSGGCYPELYMQMPCRMADRLCKMVGVVQALCM